MSRRTALWLLVLIVLGGVALRAYALTARSVWFDEAFTWRLSQYSILELVSRTAADVHPPLYYLLLKAWQWIFGTSLLALRSLSVLMAGTAIIGTYLFAASGWRSRSIGILAAALLAVSAWQIPLAWETRMYMLGLALGMFSSWLLLRGVRASLYHEGRRRPVLGWILYSLLIGALLYVHNFGLLILLAHVIFVMGLLVIQTRGRLAELGEARLFKHAALALSLIVLLYLPWIPVFLQQSSRINETYWVPPLSAASIPDTAYRFFQPTLSEPSRFAGIVVLALLAGGYVWLLVGEKKSRDAAYLTILCGALPILLVIVISWFGQSLYQDRFFVFFHAFIAVGLAVLLHRARSVRLPWVLGMLAIVASLLAYLHYWRELRLPDRPGLAAAVRAVAREHKAVEPVLVSSPFMFLPTVYYDVRELDARLSPKLLHDSDIPFFAGASVIEPEEVVRSEIFEAAETLWLIDTTGFGEQETFLPPPWRRLTRETYPEVFPHQGEVIVSHWQR